MTEPQSSTTTEKLKITAPQPISNLAPDLDAGLRRLKLAAIRRTAPEVLLTAKTQRWTPEEVLRTLVESELAARDASNIVNRLKAAAFPVAKTLESFDVCATCSAFPSVTSRGSWCRNYSAAMPVSELFEVQRQVITHREGAVVLSLE